MPVLASGIVVTERGWVQGRNVSLGPHLSSTAWGTRGEMIFHLFVEGVIMYIASNLPKYQLVKLPHHHTSHLPTGIYSMMILLAHSYSYPQWSGQPDCHDDFKDLEPFLFADSLALNFTLPVLLVKNDSNDSNVLSDEQLQLTSCKLATNVWCSILVQRHKMFCLSKVRVSV